MAVHRSEHRSRHRPRMRRAQGYSGAAVAISLPRPKRLSELTGACYHSRERNGRLAGYGLEGPPRPRVNCIRFRDLQQVLRETHREPSPCSVWFVPRRHCVAVPPEPRDRSLQSPLIRPCPNKPNCVSSRAPEGPRRMDPIRYQGSVEDARQRATGHYRHLPADHCGSECRKLPEGGILFSDLLVRRRRGIRV